MAARLHRGNQEEFGENFERDSVRSICPGSPTLIPERKSNSIIWIKAKRASGHGTRILNFGFAGIFLSSFTKKPKPYMWPKIYRVIKGP